MAMSETASILYDTHATVRRLTTAGMPETHAEAVVGEQVHLIQHNLATKADIEKFRLETNASIDALRQETKAGIEALASGNQGEHRNREERHRKVDHHHEPHHRGHTGRPGGRRHQAHLTPPTPRDPLVCRRRARSFPPLIATVHRRRDDSAPETPRAGLGDEPLHPHRTMQHHLAGASPARSSPPTPRQRETAALTSKTAWIPHTDTAATCGTS